MLKNGLLGNKSPALGSMLHLCTATPIHMLCLSHRLKNPWLQVPPSRPSGAQYSVEGIVARYSGCRASLQQQQTASRAAGIGTAKQNPRFYAPRLPQTVGSCVTLEPEEAKHAVKVLRLKEGDLIELCDGKGGVALSEVAHIDKSSATVVAVAEPEHIDWQGPQWVLAAACLTLKGGRTDWLIEKATELGAYAVLPLITERSQTGTTQVKFKSLSSKAAAASDNDPHSSRLQRLALAATKQSLRAHGLQLLPAQPLQQLLPTLRQSPVSLVGTAGAQPVMQVLQQVITQQQQRQQLGPPCQTPGTDRAWCKQPCYLLVGPEGDFTPQELQDMVNAGVLPVGLGPNRLRTETAALALLTSAVLAIDAVNCDHGAVASV